MNQFKKHAKAVKIGTVQHYNKSYIVKHLIELGYSIGGGTNPSFNKEFDKAYPPIAFGNTKFYNQEALDNCQKIYDKCLLKKPKAVKQKVVSDDRIDRILSLLETIADELGVDDQKNNGRVNGALNRFGLVQRA